MPFIVQDLIAENPTVVVTTPDELVQDALQRMIEHDFSQLPVVDKENRPLGMVTSESILRALTGFGANLNQLRVEHAIIRADTYRGDADLFELLDRLRDTYAVLIVDSEGRLIGIVTNYDTAEYFRRRAEDIMLVEDIETMLKDYIQAAFTNESGELNDSELEKAVQRITDTGKAMREKFEKALIHYLTLQNGGGSSAKPDNDWLEQVYEKHYEVEKPGKTFEDLSLFDFIELLLDKSRWSKYQSIFHLDRGAIRNLLNRVRDTRNALAHFRGEITASQRDHLRFSANWLAQYQDAISKLLVKADESTVSAVIAETQPAYEVSVQESINVADEAIVSPIADEAGPRESRYASLAIWLQNRPPTEDSTELTFEQVEEIIGGELPNSAYSHRAWWANDSVGHIQSQQWLEVGWKVHSISMSKGVVRFARIKERQKAYNLFYSELLEKLRQQPDFENIEANPASKFWQHIESMLVSGKHVAIISFSFRRGGIFRIELYIDTNEQDLNKEIFSRLFNRREEIETHFGDKLIWEELPNNRASRIAVNHSGSITDEKSLLNELQIWAIKNITAFKSAIWQPAIEEAEHAIYEDSETRN